MLRWIALPLALVAALLLLAFGYAAKGYLDARSAAQALRRQADSLIVDGHGAQDLGEGRVEQLLTIQDPGFYDHKGVDLASPGAGMTTLTQSLAKRVGFETFRPGIAKLRQIGFALGLEAELDKAQIIALFLDTVEMGRGPQGWMVGFFDASVAIYNRPARKLSDNEFLRLVAVMIAPGSYDLVIPDAALVERVERLRRRLTGQCSPGDVFDVWLEGCSRRPKEAPA